MIHTQTTLTDVLFIYAKRNETVRYVQGMNEVLGTLYFVFGSDEDAAWRDQAEADVFFCFEILMAEIADLFIQTMDNTASGLNGRMKCFISLLERHDKEVYDGNAT
jgi:TBC1 domain family member 13